MSKRFLAFALVLILALGSAVYVSAEDTASGVLEAPMDFSVRLEYDSEFKLRWVDPESLFPIFEDPEAALGYDGDLHYLIDWKVNDGDWNIALTEEDPGYNSEIHDPFHGLLYLEDPEVSAYRISEIFFVTWHLYPEDDPEYFDLENNTYYFRVRYKFVPYYEEDPTLYSPYSEVIAIGKDAGTSKITELAPPEDLKVEIKRDSHGKPYFQLDWTVPESIKEINKKFPVFHVIDFKVGDGKWLSETTSWEWLPIAPSSLLMSSDTFDPIERNLPDVEIIDENVYYFKIFFMGRPSAEEHIFSEYSNVASTKVPAYSNVSDILKGEVDDADEKGLIPDSLRGKDMTQPITREEFATCAVKFYEMVTGKTAVPHPTKTFKDSTNPEVLKAFNLGITSGVGDGTKFEPNSFLIRQQMSAMITRTLSACFEDLVFDVEGVPDFNDQHLIAKYATVPVKFMAKYKITVGNGKGSFNPNGTCTREQALAFLIRAYNYRDQYYPQ